MTTKRDKSLFLITNTEYIFLFPISDGNVFRSVVAATENGLRR